MLFIFPKKKEMKIFMKLKMNREVIWNELCKTKSKYLNILL